MECLSFCIANSVDLARLDNHFKAMLVGYSSIKTRDTLKVTPNDAPHKKIFVFKNGTVVAWGFKRHQIGEYLETIRLFADKLVPFSVHDEFSYQISDKTTIEPHDVFDVDCLTIALDDDDLKLSLSYGFSQSVKLQYFETTLETLIEKYTPLIQGLSRKGFMKITRNRIRQVIGDILSAITEMNLISNFLYHPKYFWQHPTLEEHFSMLERYLHIQRRVNAINHRLDTLNEIFAMFNGYLEDRHAHSLEVVIIILIAIEILLSIFKFYT